MANWSNILITNIGATKLSEAIAGEELVFTRIAIGDDRQAGNASLVTAMKSEVAHTSPVTVKATGNKVNIRGAFLSQFLTTSFYMKEIGLFALIRSSLGVPGPEFLIAYGTALDTNGDWIDALSPNTSIERVFEFAITISTDASVSVAIEPLALATKADIIDFLKIEDLQDGSKALKVQDVESEEISVDRIYGKASGLLISVPDAVDAYQTAIEASAGVFADTGVSNAHVKVDMLHVTSDSYIENMRSPSISSGQAWIYNSASSTWDKLTSLKYGAISFEITVTELESVFFALFTFSIPLQEARGVVFSQNNTYPTVLDNNMSRQRSQMFFVGKGKTSVKFRVNSDDGFSDIGGAYLSIHLL